MKKWNVVVDRSIEMYEEAEIVVEAETEEEAKELAIELARENKNLYWECVEYDDVYVHSYNVIVEPIDNIST